MNKPISAMFLAISFLVASSSALEMGIGIKGGLNLASFYGEDEKKISEGSDEKVHLGMSAGASFSFGIAKVFALQPEILFSMKGSKYESNGASIKINVNYLEIPVLAKITFPTEVVKPFIYVGPSLGILLSAKVKVEYQGESESEDIKDETKSVDFGLATGAGIGISAGPGQVILEARYNPSFLTIDDGDDIEVKNSCFSFMLGYSFLL